MNPRTGVVEVCARESENSYWIGDGNYPVVRVGPLRGLFNLLAAN